MKENYTVSFTLNDVAQCRLVKAESAEQARAYFAEIEPAAIIAGAALDQCHLERRGCPVEIVPDGWTPAPAPAAEEEQEEQTAPIDGETQDDEQPTRYQHIKAYLDSLSDAGKVNIWNEYTDATNNPDDRIYSIEEFDEVFSGSKPWDIARTCYYSGQFCPADDWFWFDGYGNAESSDFPESTLSPYDVDALAQYIVDNDEDFYDDTIRAILDGEEVRA